MPCRTTFSRQPRIETEILDGAIEYFCLNGLDLLSNVIIQFSPGRLTLQAVYGEQP